jgi:DNA gyrase/topoisomerase IV subunit A
MTYKDTTTFIKDTSRDYSIYVCQSRGIPSVSDGLKDAQRKALFVMKSQSDKIKTISLAGRMISENVYLHGDAAACDTISLMAAPYCNNVTLLHGIGAFGTRVGPTDWGAPRYTYVKKSTHTENLIYQDYDIIPLKENYDGSVLEPKHFLPLIPIVLLNGVSGIAVGWSTEILPRSLDALIDATLAALDDKKKLPELLPYYDFLNATVKSLGNNSYEFSGKVEIDGSSVIVTELPPTLNLEKFKERLNRMEDEDQIQNYTDKSTKNIRVEIKFKRGSIDGWTKDKAIDFLKLRSKTTERIVVLDWNGTSIKQYESAEKLIRDFVEWRLGFYKVRYEKLLADANRNLNWYLAIKECMDQGLPAFLTKAKDKQDVVDKIRKITKGITLDDGQVDRLSSLPSYRWAKDSYAETVDKIKEFKAIIADYNAILKDKEKMRAIYRKEIQELKKMPAVER